MRKSYTCPEHQPTKQDHFALDNTEYFPGPQQTHTLCANCERLFPDSHRPTTQLGAMVTGITLPNYARQQHGSGGLNILVMRLEERERIGSRSQAPFGSPTLSQDRTGLQHPESCSDGGIADQAPFGSPTLSHAGGDTDLQHLESPSDVHVTEEESAPQAPPHTHHCNSEAESVVHHFSVGNHCTITHEEESTGNRPGCRLQESARQQDSEDFFQRPVTEDETNRTSLMVGREDRTIAQEEMERRLQRALPESGEEEESSGEMELGRTFTDDTRQFTCNPCDIPMHSNTDLHIMVFHIS